MLKFLLMIVAVILMISGCSDKTPVIEDRENVKIENSCIQENVVAPKWVCIPKVDNFYSSIGVSQKSKAGFGFMQREALANGRSNLAQQIQTDVKDKVENFTRSTGNGESEVLDKVTTAVSKQVARVNLRGSNINDSWVSPSGVLYLLVTAPKDSINLEVKEAIKTSLKNDDALWQQFQSNNSLVELEKEFD